jgi:hypothetical protein
MTRGSALAEPTAVDETSDGTSSELFDPAPYLAPVPTLDGNRADTLKVTFTGTIEIDPMIADDLEWFKRLKFGSPIALQVEGAVTKVNWSMKTSGEEGIEHVTTQVGVKVDSIDLAGA